MSETNNLTDVGTITDIDKLCSIGYKIMRRRESFLRSADQEMRNLGIIEERINKVEREQIEKDEKKSLIKSK